MPDEQPERLRGRTEITVTADDANLFENNLVAALGVPAEFLGTSRAGYSMSFRVEEQSAVFTINKPGRKIEP